jgi:hypothetical protein
MNTYISAVKMGENTGNSLRMLAIFLVLGFARCNGSPDSNEEDGIMDSLKQSESLIEYQNRVDTMTDYPVEVVAKMTALENLDSNPLIDENLLSVWKRERWDGSMGMQDFFSDGTANSNFGSFEYTTCRFKQTNWLITIKREPILGRSIQAYYISGDSLYLKFLHPEAEWECWYRPDRSL